MPRTTFLLIALAMGCSSPQAPQTPETLVESSPEPIAPPTTSAATQHTRVTSAEVEARVSDARSRMMLSDAGRLLWQSMEAHGGLERWYSSGHLAFRFTYHPVGKDPNDTRQVVDVWSARARHHVVGRQVTYGWDGKQAWIQPPDGDAGTNPRFWSLTPYYFVGVPFVLADRGTVWEIGPDVLLEGVSYNTVKVTFEPGTGDAPGDFYVVYIHPETKRMGGLRYIVSYPGFFPDGGHSPEKAMAYDGAQTVGGITFPERIRTFKWDGQTHGEVTTNTAVHEMSWVQDASFDVPEGAKILEGY